jgi:hypothetical protein
MTFVIRDGNGKIVTSALAPLAGFSYDEIDDDAPELLEFLEEISTPRVSAVSAGQLIQALAELDLLAAVDAAVAQADALTQRLWARAAIFPRNDPLVIAVAEALGKTPTEIDDIFALAATK